MDDRERIEQLERAVNRLHARLYAHVNRLNWLETMVRRIFGRVFPQYSEQRAREEQVSAVPADMEYNSFVELDLGNDDDDRG